MTNKESENLPPFLKKFPEEIYHQNEKENRMIQDSENNKFSLEKLSREIPGWQLYQSLTVTDLEYTKSTDTSGKSGLVIKEYLILDYMI